jgi:hypothetical protein
MLACGGLAIRSYPISTDAAHTNRAPFFDRQTGNPMSRKTTNPHQLDLFGGQLPVDDPVATYYRRLRRAGVWLGLDPKTGEVHAISDSDGVPAWAHRGALVYYDRIKADVLRAQGSIVPSLAREELEGGAELIRLPGSPQLDPPVRPRQWPCWDGPGAA